LVRTSFLCRSFSIFQLNFTTLYSGSGSKVFVLTAVVLNITCCASIATSQLIYQYLNRDNNGIRKKLDWLEIYETREYVSLVADKSVKRKIRSKPIEKQIDHNDYLQFWKRVKRTHWIMFHLSISSSAFSHILFAYATFMSVPNNYHFPLTILNTMHLLMTQVFSYNYFYFSMGLLHQVCYHLLLRFKSINRKLTDLSKKMSLKPDLKSYNRSLILLLREHNSICSDITRYNHYWKIYLALLNLFNPIIVQLCCYVAFISDSGFIFKLFFGLGVTIISVFISIPDLSASSVRKKV